MNFYPRTLEVLISESCNMGCKYCFEGLNPNMNENVSFELMKELVDQYKPESFYIFGGEPLLNIKVLEQTINYVIDNENISKRKKENLLKGLRNITTNGTLIKRNIEKIKKLKLRFQISIDGPDFIHNHDRPYKNSEKGTYNDVMEGIETCHKEGVDWSIHGVISEFGMRNYAALVKWKYDFGKKMDNSPSETVKTFSHNWALQPFELNFTDELIDTVQAQMEEVVKWIISLNELTGDEKWQLFKSACLRENVGGVCGVGRALLVSDRKKNLYPCHRAVDSLTNYTRDGVFTLGKLDDVEGFSNFKLYNRLTNIADKGFMYGPNTIYDKRDTENKPSQGWIHWCPISNIETSKDEAFLNSKYVVFNNEIYDFVKNYLSNKYFNKDKDKNTKKHIVL